MNKNTKNKHRNKRGQYASLKRKAERMAWLTLIIFMVWFYVHQGTQAREQELQQLQKKVIELQQIEQELIHQSIELQNNPDLSEYEAEIEKQRINALPKFTGFATAYSCEGLETDAEILMNCPSKIKHPNGKTATGTVPDANRTIACDPNNLGKTFFIEGVGERTCEDTGGAIKGAGRFDVYVDHVDEARQFGGRTVTYRVVDNG